MTTFTRTSRLDKRDAHLIAKHGDDIKSLLVEMREHSARAPFDPATASFDEMKLRFNTITAYADSVLSKFPYAQRAFFPHNLSGVPIAFIPADSQFIEVVLRKRPHRYGVKPAETPYEYHSVLLPAELFGGRIGAITSYTRTTLRSNRDDQARKDREAAEAEQKRLVAERDKLDKDIAAAEKKLEAMREKKEKLPVPATA
jgi:hypothetical protein